MWLVWLVFFFVIPFLSRSHMRCSSSVVTAARATATTKVAGAGAPDSSPLRRWSRSERTAARAAERRAARREAGGTKAELLEVPAAGMSPADLAQELALSDAEVVKALFMKGIMCTVNQVLDADTIKMVCDQFEVEYLDADSAGVSDAAKKTSEFVGEEDLDSLAPRPRDRARAFQPFAPTRGATRRRPRR